MSTLRGLMIGNALLAFVFASKAQGDVVIAEDFTNGPGCFSNYNADVFFASAGELTVGTNQIRGGGGCGTQYRYALCNTPVPGDFVLDVDLTVVNTQEFRAGVVYGWQGPQKYYIFHLNDYENGVIQLIAFDIAQSPCERMVAEKQFDSQRDRAYLVRVEVSGTHHTVYIDGNLELDVTDTGYAGGQIGLAASFNGYGKFDNLRVTGACSEWKEAPVPLANRPAARGHHAMAFHPANGIVMFGGDNPSPGYLDDTWAWNGTVWTQLPVAGPPPREQHAMTYAPACGGVILFGGAGETSDLNDMWRWDGQTWTNITPNPLPGSWPGVRRAHGMAYDESRGVIVLFGGVTNPCCPWPDYGDTWEWNCSTPGWTRVSQTGPSPREGHSMAYHPCCGIVLFGGGGNATIADNDTWCWNGAQWSLIHAAGPSPRMWAPMTYDKHRDRVVLFGGNIDIVGTGINDTWEWTCAGWSEILPIDALSSPSPRSRGALEFDPAREASVLFGGIGRFNTPALNDTWEFAGCPTPECQTDADCDDGLFCNGSELCIASACLHGLPLCAVLGRSCNETYKRCCDCDGCEHDIDCDTLTDDLDPCPEIPDCDGDALLDGWEVLGYDHDHDGHIDVDLPAMGADMLIKDIFVEIDWMQNLDGSKSLNPQLDFESPNDLLPIEQDPDFPSWRAVVQSFLDAPVSNPSNATGIRLHIDIGQGPPFTGGNALPWEDNITVNGFGLDDFSRIARANFSDARRAVFHYCLFVNKFNGSDRTGNSPTAPDSRFVVAASQLPNEQTRAGTFMHELGHNLGLLHGGQDCVNRKPNYLRVYPKNW